MNNKISPIGATKSVLILVLSVTLASVWSTSCSTVNNLNKELEQSRFTIEDNRSTYNECWELLYNENSDLMLENTMLREKIMVMGNMGTTPFPYKMNKEELDLLCRCAQAEAGYNNFCSQRHVVNVILNRVISDDFPNTIEEVIYQRYGKRYQFQVVKDGRINLEATEETIENIKDALLFGSFELPSDVVYFYATGTPSNCTDYLECEGSTFGY